jgi:CheY-like chemotaxis protein
VIDLNETVEGMFQMLRRLIGEDIELIWKRGSKLWPVRIDPSQVDQIMANLCVNARDAIKNVGKITIETRNVAIDETYSALLADVVPGEYVMLTVSDTGCGMDKDTLSKIFEPFFTTKELGKGTGLGLPMVYGIVKQNNGFINVYSEPGQETTFKIYLPRYADESKQRRKKAVPAKPAARGNETILLVEDEQSILEVTSEILERQGYTVLTARVPSEAIRLAEKHRNGIHMLITDVIMPEMNGRDLAEKIHKYCPNLKPLFMSGHSADVIADHGVLDTGIHFIQKPFSMKDLAAKVRLVLDER